jgi:hypothetical protein
MGQNCTRMELHDPLALAPAKEKVSAIAKRLLGEKQGGLISIFYHPCEWVHEEFWDAVNFRRGANPPREQWKAPPQRPAKETEAAFKRFGEYMDYIRSIPKVRFVTASDMPMLYPDAVHSTGASEKDLTEIASRLTAPGATGIDFQVIENRAYSTADQFEVLAEAAAQLIAGSKPRCPLKVKGFLGPDRASSLRTERNHFAWAAFRDATLDVVNFIETEHRVPSQVFVGAETVPPSDFLVALAATYEFCRRNGRLPTAEGVAMPKNVEFTPARYIAHDTPGLFGGWVIHKEGFRAPNILEVARLQTWTLKPAIRQ